MHMNPILPCHMEGVNIMKESIYLTSWNKVQQIKQNGSWLTLVTDDRINWQHADKWQTDTFDTDHHVIDQSVAMQHVRNVYKILLFLPNFSYLS